MAKSGEIYAGWIPPCNGYTEALEVTIPHTYVDPIKELVRTLVEVDRLAELDKPTQIALKKLNKALERPSDW